VKKEIYYGERKINTLTALSIINLQQVKIHTVTFRLLILLLLKTENQLISLYIDHNKNKVFFSTLSALFCF
jgi:hypothetical protein